jgi:hypothetical protein
LWAIPSYSYESADHFWNGDGRELSAYNRSKINTYALYAEYAFHERNSLTLNSGYLQIDESLNGRRQGLSALEAGWKFLLCNECRWSSTAELTVLFPVSKQTRRVHNSQPGAQISLLHSRWFAFRGGRGWIDLLLGYRRYAAAHADQLRGECAFNLLPCKNVRLTALAQFYWGHDGRWRSLSCHSQSRHCPAQALCTVQLEGAVQLCPHICAIAGFFEDFWGRRTFMRKGVLGGIWISY